VRVLTFDTPPAGIIIIIYEEMGTPVSWTRSWILR
jgi:hypothetical protein